MRGVAVLQILLLALATSKAQASAEVPKPGRAGQARSNVAYVSKNVFSLPVLLDQSVAATLSRVELYGRKSAGDAWKLVQTIQPSERAFVVKINGGDGEYEFAVVGVDMQGRRTVADLAQKEADSIICVDTQAPQIDIRFAQDSVEGIEVICTADDVNLQPFAIEFYFQTQDGQWRRLLPTSEQSDRYCIPNVAALTGLIKGVAKDRAGNQATREINISKLRQTNGAANTPLAKDKKEGPPLPSVPGAPIPPPLPLVAASQTAEQKASFVTPRKEPELLAMQPPEPPLPLPQPSEQTAQDAFRFPTQRPAPQAPLPTPAAQTPAAAHERQFVNRPRVYLGYEVESGAGNAAKIQIWLTSDEGRSWIHYGEDADGASPAEIYLPGEGVTGIRLVAGAQQPSEADAANGLVNWIELDVTPPTAQMNLRKENNHVTIAWSTRDKNLAAEPVDLYYASDRQGPWLPIAASLAASADYRWEIPEETSTQPLCIALVAHDKAGNSTVVVESLEASPGQSAPAPRVRFLGVSSQSPQTAAPAPLRLGEQVQPPAIPPLP